VLAPLIVFLDYSFWLKKGFDFVNVVRLDNYAYVATNPTYWTLIAKSIVFGIIVVAATFLLALPGAYFVARYAGSAKNIFLVGVLIPLYTSALVRILAWRSVLGVNGFINGALEWLGVIDTPIRALLFSTESVLVVLSYVYFPFMFLALWVTLEMVDMRYFDAAADLGASGPTRTRRVLLPLVLPGAAAGSLIVFVLTAGDYITVNLIGGASATTIINAIVEQFGAANNWPLGAAVATVFIVCLLAFLLVVAAGFARLRPVRLYFRLDR
jgi:spermidine/putrescine transport system permease protein